MSLDYTDGCVNFRDVGEFINLISNEQVLKEGMLFRGGSIDYVKDLNEIKNAQSILNLRNGADSKTFDIDYYHFPMSNKIEKYETSQKEVKVWLNQIIKTFENPNVKFPILIHCLSGKDRTGIVIAVVLLILGIERDIIKEEYLLSEGEVKEEWIELSLNGIQNLDTYFDRVKLSSVRENVEKIFLTEFNRKKKPH